MTPCESVNALWLRRKKTLPSDFSRSYPARLWILDRTPHGTSGHGANHLHDEADKLNEFCEDASGSLEWTIDANLISVMAAPEFYATGIYNAGGMVNSRKFDLNEIGKHFAK